MRIDCTSIRSHARHALALACTVAMSLSLAACGDSDSKASSDSSDIGLPQLTGVTAKGDLGKKPEVTFKTDGNGILLYPS